MGKCLDRASYAEQKDTSYADIKSSDQLANTSSLVSAIIIYLQNQWAP